LLSHTAHKTLNLRLTTSDNITLGAWLVLSDSYIRHTSPLPTPDTLEDHVPKALATYPTALFFHGNAASRAVQYRVHHVQTWSSRMGCNALIIDYRGFGDSSGTPSEEGLNKDAWAAYDYLLEHGAQSKDVLVVGHSLGTAVATRFVKEVEENGGSVKGLVLQAPFSNLKVLVDTYYLLGVFPLMKPLDLLPGVQSECP
jgi:abhydrolase domain-containing protein 12